jgi:hypothetical protein
MGTSDWNRVRQEGIATEVKEARLRFWVILIDLFFPLLLCWVGIHCGIYKILIMYQLYHTWIHPLHCSPLFSPPRIHRIVTTGIINFACMWVHFLHHIHPPTPFPCHRPLLLFPALPPGQDLFYLLLSDFAEGKRKK